MSELAEDRTQRAFDSAPAPRAEIHYTMSDTTGENVIDDGRGFGKAPQQYIKHATSRESEE